MASPIKRDPLTLAGLWVVGLAGIITSWAGWTGLTELAGFDQTAHLHYFWGGGVDLHVSWIVGICVDVFAAVAVRIWLTAHWASARTRNTAKAWAIVSIMLGVAANALYHVLADLKTTAPIAIIVLLSAVPSIMTGVIVHLAVLLGDDRRQALAAGAATPAREETRGSWLLRTAGAARDVVQLFKEPLGEAPAGQEGGGVSPAQPVPNDSTSPDVTRPRPARRLAMVDGPKDRMRAYYLDQRSAGWPATQGTPLTGAALDKKFDTNNYGRAVIREIRQAEEREEMSS